MANLNITKGTQSQNCYKNILNVASAAVALTVEAGNWLTV